MNIATGLRTVGMALTLILLMTPSSEAAQTSGANGTIMVVAILPFATSGEELADMGADVPTLFHAFLSKEPSLVLVERAEVDKALSEIELGLTGLVDPATAAKVGHLIGAQVLVTGRIFPVRNELVIVAKTISVETGRVYGATQSMPMSGSIVETSRQLAVSVRDTILSKRDTLVAKAEPHQDLIAKLRPHVEGVRLPTVTVTIGERSVGRGVPDPVAETEIARVLHALGFRVLDAATTRETPEVEITGEAFSEFGMRKGHLVSSKGRVEVRTVRPRQGEIVFVDHAVAVAVDLSPEIAGKKAIAKAASQLVERLVPALVKSR